jgi:tight adherence protein C
MTSTRTLLQALALSAAWTLLLAVAPSLWPRPRSRPLPHHSDVPPTRPTTTSTQAGPTPRTSWVTALGATIRRHTIQRLVARSGPETSPVRPLEGRGPAIGPTTNPHRQTIARPIVATTTAPRVRATSGASAPTATATPATTAISAASVPDPPTPATAAGTTPGTAVARTAGRDQNQGADRRTGWAALASLALLPLAPALAPVPLACALAGPVLTTRSARRRHDAALVDQLPDVVDLLSLTTAAGLPTTAALTAIAARPGGPLGAAIGRAAAHLRAGGPLAGALAYVGAVGSQARPLVDALAHHDRYGSPLQPALERVAIEARARRRRQAEESARRLPVTLLFPLLLTTFPAFVALTVVPLLAGSLRALSL